MSRHSASASAARMIAARLLAASSRSYILPHQRLTRPSWVPVIGKDDFILDASFTTAAGVLPGQGQR